MGWIPNPTLRRHGWIPNLSKPARHLLLNSASQIPKLAHRARGPAPFWIPNLSGLHPWLLAGFQIRASWTALAAAGCRPSRGLRAVADDFKELALVEQQDESPELDSGQGEQQARVERQSWRRELSHRWREIEGRRPGAAGLQRDRRCSWLSAGACRGGSSGTKTLYQWLHGGYMTTQKRKSPA